MAYAVLYVLNWVLVRSLFRLSVEGRNHLPTSRPFIVAPNHASPFDPPILAAALPLGILQQTDWAGRQGTVLRTRLRRVLSRLTNVIPIGDDASALSAGVTVLEQGRNLVWFPEGKRSLDGRLQEFKPGIVSLLDRCDVPVVPVFIDGAYAACPSSARVPRFRAKVVVRIGAPRTRKQLGVDTSTVEHVSRSAESVRRCVAELQQP